MPFQTLLIGRAGNAQLRLHDSSVSRFHAEVTLTELGRCYLVDRGSTRGTFLRKPGEGWVRHRRGYVDRDAPLRFGKLETSLSVLLEPMAGIGLEARQPEYEPLSIRPRRNLASGEVERSPSV